MRYAMANKWLEQQGLLSRKHLWGQLAPPSWNRLVRSRMLSWCGGWAGQPARLPDFVAEVRSVTR